MLIVGNAAIMLIVEENKTVTKMFDAMVLDTIYEVRERQEHGVTKTTLVSTKLMIRIQITFFGVTTAGKVAEEQEGETPAPARTAEAMDGAVQLPDSEDEEDEYYETMISDQHSMKEMARNQFLTSESMMQQQQSIKTNTTDQIKLTILCVWNSTLQTAHQRQTRKDNITIQLSYL